jgi:hypothetical protein
MGNEANSFTKIYFNVLVNLGALSEKLLVKHYNCMEFVEVSTDH